jgi:hypothetical protein
VPSLQKLAQKVILVVTFLCLTTVSPQEGYAEVTVRQTEVGRVVRINIDGLKGLNDPKIDCVPKNDNWEAIQKLNGDPMLLFFPDTEGLYTFVMAGNKDNKTFYHTFQVQVGKGPKPPGPGPGPGPGSGSGSGSAQTTRRSGWKVHRSAAFALPCEPKQRQFK